MSSEADWEDVPASAPPSKDVYSLARMIASEAGGTPEIAQRGVAHAAVNYAGGRPITEILMRGRGEANGRYGPQDEGRYASTAREPTPTSLRIAHEVLSGQSQDPTGGAIQWDSPKAYADPSRAGTVAASRQAEGKRIVTLPGVPSSTFRFYAKGAGGGEADWEDVPKNANEARSYALTNYASSPENKAGPLSQATQDATPPKVGDHRNAFTRFMHAAIPDSRPGVNGAPRYDDPIAHDPIAQDILTGTLGAGAGALVGGGGAAIGLARRMLAGGASGLTQSATGGASDLGSLAAGTALGSVLNRPGSAGVAPHLPVTQAEIDAATFARAGKPGPDILREGASGVSRMSTEAEQLAAARMEARKAVQRSDLGATENAVRADGPGPMRTDPDVWQLQQLRASRTGPAGPLNPEADARLRFIQNQLGHKEGTVTSTLQADGLPTAQGRPGRAAPMEDTGGIPEPVQQPEPTRRVTNEFVGPDAEAKMAAAARRPVRQAPMPPPDNNLTAKVVTAGPEVTFDQLRGLHRELNDRLGAPVPGDYGRVGDELGRGVVRDAVRRFDPRMGPALDRYSTEEANLGRMGELLWNKEGSIPPDALSRQEAARTRISRAGNATDKSPQGDFNNEARLQELAKLEPSLANPIDQVRAVNTAERRRIRLPIPQTAHPGSIARAVADQADNARFWASPPQIDPTGLVAGQAATAGSNLPINPLLRARAQNKEDDRRRSNLLRLQRHADEQSQRERDQESFARQLAAQQAQ